jgi:hypothetical protein
LSPLDRRVQRPGVGREGDVLGLHGGVDGDPRQVPGAQRPRCRAPPAGHNAQNSFAFNRLDVVHGRLLKGARTHRWRTMPPELHKLQDAVRRVVDSIDLADRDLPVMSIRFCLGFVPPVSSALVGAASTAELEEALVAASGGAIPAEIVSSIASLAIEDEVLMNPSSWLYDNNGEIAVAKFSICALMRKPNENLLALLQRDATIA